MIDLDAIRADLDRRVPAIDHDDRNVARGLLAEVERLQAQLDATSALHCRDEWLDVCVHCRHLYPCPTTEALKGDQE